MKVLFDYQVFQNQIYGGISKYFVELVKHFSDNISVEIGLKYSNNIHLSEGLPTSYLPIVDYQPNFLSGLNFKGKGSLLRIYSKIFHKSIIDYYEENLNESLIRICEDKFDIFHPTYYNPYFLDYLKKPFVLTVHDLIYELFPEYFPPDDETALNKRKLIDKAEHVITVSENTKKDIVNYYNVDPSKITVVYHGITERSPIPDDNRIIPDRYFLYVGDRKGYKNFYFALHSIAERLKELNIKVVCVGPSFSSDELQLFSNLNVSDRLYHKLATEGEMRSIYKGAVALLFPSLYEGFGFPIIEAFNNGCPVLLSESDCFREIAGDAALYFNPKSGKDICHLIEIASTNQEAMDTLRSKGTERVKLFSLKETARKTAEVYNFVLSR